LQELLQCCCTNCSTLMCLLALCWLAHVKKAVLLAESQRARTPVCAAAASSAGVAAGFWSVLLVGLASLVPGHAGMRAAAQQLSAAGSLPAACAATAAASCLSEGVCRTQPRGTQATEEDVCRSVASSA
jgi:hypothetical protein